jgi:hypothetical protein
MYLLDTNVISELRKAINGRADRQVVKWEAGVSRASLYLSVITILELEIGVLQMERRDALQGRLLRVWLDRHVLPAFEGHILGIDPEIAPRCARLHVPNPQNEGDTMMAATALVHGMTIVTRNVRDFEGTGVKLLNPWE